MSRKAVLWPADDIEMLVRMRSQGVTWPKIAEAVGRPIGSCISKFENERIKRRRAATPAPGAMTAMVPLRVLVERARRQDAPHRDLAGAVFGDPPKGFSALDRRRG